MWHDARILNADNLPLAVLGVTLGFVRYVSFLPPLSTHNLAAFVVPRLLWRGDIMVWFADDFSGRLYKSAHHLGTNSELCPQPPPLVLSIIISIAALVIGIIAIVRSQQNERIQLHYAMEKLKILEKETEEKKTR